ncbi:MAG: MCE family protein [Candidatus Omnitrophica bacterium]|nr:MCE family protein [Candidatus Omnitrophota bacterium]
MKKDNNEVTVGVFVILGFVFLTLVLFFVSGVYFFRSGYAVDVLYEYVSILNKGAPVRMAGVRVGEVSDVRLFYDETKQMNRVKVKLFIEKGVEVRENYEFTIRGTHILSEPHVEITPQPGNFRLLRKGDVVEGVGLISVEALMDKAHEILGHLAALSGKLDENIDDGTVKDLKGMIVNLSELSKALSASLQGSEGDIRQSIHNIESSTASLEAVLSKVKHGEGTVGQLLVKDDLYREMDAFVKDLRAHPWKLLKKDSQAQKRKWYFLFLASIMHSNPVIQVRS